MQVCLASWVATLDDKTRESHQKVDGEWQELDKPFSNGLMYPGDPRGSAAEVVNCRCTLDDLPRWYVEKGGNEFKRNGLNDEIIQCRNYAEFKEKYLQSVSDGVTMFFRKGYTHRKVSEKGHTIIDKLLYNKLTSKARKEGAKIVVANAQMEAHLAANDATASSIGDVIIFSKEPTVSDVLEELYHFKQNKDGLYISYPHSQRYIMCEIEAKKYLIAVEGKYNIPSAERELTRQHLKKLKTEKAKMQKAGDWID